VSKTPSFSQSAPEKKELRGKKKGGVPAPNDYFSYTRGGERMYDNIISHRLSHLSRGGGKILLSKKDKKRKKEGTCLPLAPCILCLLKRKEEKNEKGKKNSE